MLLGRYPEFLCKRASEVEAWVVAKAGGKNFDASISEQNAFEYRVNAARLKDVSLLVTSCSAATDVRYGPVNYPRYIFQIRNSSRFTVGHHTVERKPGEAGVLVPNNLCWRAENNAGVHNLSLRIDFDALKQKLAAIIGSDSADGLIFKESHDQTNISRGNLLHGFILQVAAELETARDEWSATVIAEMEQALVVRFLIYSRHNLTDLLERTPASAGDAQFKRAVEYLYANWDQPFKIEALVNASGVSARSLFRKFREQRECSPEAFLKVVRLGHARSMLQDHHGEISVKSIALRCGFHSFGHFARSYRDLFGELPSKTLGRSPENRKDDGKNT